MGLQVTTNVASINAQNTLNRTQRDMNLSMAQLASGSRITKSADDAAGLSISETLKSTIRGYKQADRNTNDGMSIVQIAEGGLGEISNILTRLRELAVQAASDTIGDEERGFIQKEVSQIVNEAERIAQATKFGNVHLLNGEGEGFGIQVGINNDDFQDRISFDAAEIEATTARLGIDGFDFSDKYSARDALETIEGAQREINGHRATLGAIQNRFLSTSANLNTSIENFSAANSRIRDADIAASTSEMTRNNILLNASVGVLAQANQNPAMALKLIG